MRKQKKEGEYSLEIDAHLEEITIVYVVVCERNAQWKRDGQGSGELTLFPSRYLDTVQPGPD